LLQRRKKIPAQSWSVSQYPISDEDTKEKPGDDSIWLVAADDADLVDLLDSPFDFASARNVTIPKSEFKPGATVFFDYAGATEEQVRSLPEGKKYIVEGIRSSNIVTVRAARRAADFAPSFVDVVRNVVTFIDSKRGGAHPFFTVTEDKATFEALFITFLRENTKAPIFTLLPDEGLGYLHLHLGDAELRDILVKAITIGGDSLPQAVRLLNPTAASIPNVIASTQLSRPLQPASVEVPNFEMSPNLRFIYDWLPLGGGGNQEPCGKASGKFNRDRNLLTIDTLWYTLY
jgi:hypothetical protein